MARNSGLFVVTCRPDEAANGAPITTGGTTLKFETTNTDPYWRHRRRAYASNMCNRRRAGRVTDGGAAIGAEGDLIGLVDQLLEAGVSANFQLKPDGADRSCRRFRSGAFAARR